MTELGPTVTTLVDLLRRRATDHPASVLYTFLPDGEAPSGRLTCGALDRQARAIAARLRSAVDEGERAVILYHPGLEYIAALFGCMYAGVTAVPAYPPRPNRTMARIDTIIRDARARVAVTTSALLPRLLAPGVATDGMRRLIWLTTDDLPMGLEETWRQPAVRADTIAVLQYTSGSTGAPKGVMVSHGNLLHNLRQMQGVGVGHSQGVCWLPPYHDMGLVAGILLVVFERGHCVLMSPLAFLQRPLRWLRAIADYGAEVSAGPNFAYDLCVNKVTPEQRAGLDLRSWKVAITGAEPVRVETLDRFAAAFSPCGFRREAFYPCYGLAEATLCVSGAPKVGRGPVVASFDRTALEQHRVVATEPGGDAAPGLVGVGRALPGQRIAIVDPETRLRCEPDRVGEIWVGGPNVAQGYWDRPDETAQIFGAHLADMGEGPFLRTGDLGFVRDGELFVTARMKDLIIIRGLNHCPQDIELTVAQCHPRLRSQSGAAVSVELVGQEWLVILQEVECLFGRDDYLDRVIEAIRMAIVEHHGVQPYAVQLLRPGSLPKTSSGKIQRHVCRAAFLTGTFKPLAEWRATVACAVVPAPADGAH